MVTLHGRHRHRIPNTTGFVDDKKTYESAVQRNSNENDICSVQRGKFFELQNTLSSLMWYAKSLAMELDALACMLSGDPALLMYEDQKARADRAEAQLLDVQNAVVAARLDERDR